METRPDPDIDDDFSELYKEYTGPPGSNATNTQDRAKPNKRSLAGSDEEEEARDPNAVPTDFTSREAKVWEAKSKATERNWKKRKEEELICKICGESGHFTQVNWDWFTLVFMISGYVYTCLAIKDFFSRVRGSVPLLDADTLLRKLLGSMDFMLLIIFAYLRQL